jgi:putative hydrolase of the HAD superfamily
MSQLDAVVFDLDDTLYPEADYVLSGFRAVAEWAELHLGIPARKGFRELKSLFDQGVRGDTFDRWLDSHHRDSAGLVRELVQVYRGHEPRLAPFPAVPELLASLGRRLRLGLLSDGYLAAQRRKLIALDIAHHFDVIVFTDEWGREFWKPSPRGYQVALRQLHVAAHEAAYVGDNPLKDFAGARHVGMHTIWVRRPGGEYSHLEPPSGSHRADMVITALDQLEQALFQPEASS